MADKYVRNIGKCTDEFKVQLLRVYGSHIILLIMVSIL
jgi:hypothetical protein